MFATTQKLKVDFILTPLERKPYQVLLTMFPSDRQGSSYLIRLHYDADDRALTARVFADSGQGRCVIRAVNKAGPGQKDWWVVEDIYSGENLYETLAAALVLDNAHCVSGYEGDD